MRFEFVRTKVDEACLSHWALYSLVTRQTRAEEGHRLPTCTLRTVRDAVL